MIEFKDVSFCYEGEEKQEKKAVVDITLSIKKGEFVVLAGGSGSGKTTLTRMINGLIPDCFAGKFQGMLRVAGQDPSQLLTVRMAELVGSVFQNPKSQFFQVNSLSELAFPLENRAVPPEKILARMDRVVDQLHMRALVDRNMFELSGGEKQKIAIASVCMSDQDIIVLDEPSSNLDMAAIRELRKALMLWKEEGKTIVIAEHRLFFLWDLIDKLVIMERGKIHKIYEQDAISLITEEILNEAGIRSYDLGCVVAAEREEKGKEPSLRIEQLKFRFGHSQRGIQVEDLIFFKGHIAAIVGNNGAGKSTLIRCLCGLEKKCESSLWLDNIPVKQSKMHTHCAMVMQDVNHQLFMESVQKELLFELKRSGKSQEECEKISVEWLERMNLLEEKESHPMAISGGQKQRVAITSAMLSGKEVVLFDEPTSGLDYAHMQRVASYIKELAAQGKTLILITHDLELILQTCDDIIHIEGGAVKEAYPLDSQGEAKVRKWFLDALRE